MLPANQWHTIRIPLRGNNIQVFIDGTKVGEATESAYARGRTGIGTGWNRVRFDDFSVTPG
ncbi:hypothetical protein EV193_115119 [Herbihabitans rhizosphaerae]|uniref:3-keto-alpha-glucoside-1,2-lyase/3-keto-2-hydroxy-glucal hydratase domain-containing protein n=1 Tax=Herbihabitans rhizosphaerae TaxID=1872711 RepID=A0A4Q7KEH1_9PSEU|nr:DUF1080 domain-containing protein [Herbihabitans rhizosphaerae]RZS31240.1 hypothetical protein EV193_115119 [Herbihabitans rhizosphaerae]